jgi:hypothetical protein
MLAGEVAAKPSHCRKDCKHDIGSCRALVPPNKDCTGTKEQRKACRKAHAGQRKACRSLVKLCEQQNPSMSGTCLQSRPILYTFAGNATGTLGTMSFNNAPFTLQVGADTQDVTPSADTCAVPEGVCHLFLVPSKMVQFALTDAGVTAALTLTTSIAVNQTFPSVNLGHGPILSGADILAVSDGAFATYDLTAAIGPVGSMSGSLAQFNCNFGCVTTDHGDLSLQSVSGVSFTAVLTR